MERVLSALVTVSARHDRGSGGEGVVSFVPPRDTVALVERALAAMERADEHEARSRRRRYERTSGGA